MTEVNPASGGSGGRARAIQLTITLAHKGGWTMKHCHSGWLVFYCVCAVAILGFALQATDGTPTGVQSATNAATTGPVTPNASPEAKALLQLLCSISGTHTMTGQHNFPNTKDRYTQQALSVSGKTPAVYSQDWGFAAPGNQDAAAARPDIVEEVKRQHQLGSIITICWHAVRPTDDEPVTFRGSVQGKLTDAQFNDLLTPGTHLHRRWATQVDAIAVFLKQLQEARVPVLWRPYHEMNGNWFWWGGRPGDRGTVTLYRQIFDRLVNHHEINNLIWVWSVDRPTTPERQYAGYFPGSQYLDVLSLDVYGSDFKQTYYDDLVALAKGKPLVLGEVGSPPSLAVLEKQPKWALYVIWAGMAGGGWGRRAGQGSSLAELVKAPRMLSLGDPAYVEATAPFRAVCGLPPLKPVPAGNPPAGDR